MALSNPYPLSFLSSKLRIDSIVFTPRRNDEMSGSGDGRFWIAQLARPLWQVEVSLSARTAAEAREIDAKMHALDGMGAFLFADPSYSPVDGNPGTAITVGSIGAARKQIGLSGLAGGFTPSAGDRLSIRSGGRTYFGSIADGGSALVSIWPALPRWVVAGQAVEMVRPVISVMVPPGGYAPFRVRPDFIGREASISMLQKV
ncbi:hypothetical protein [Cereibacter sphaeroides]|jgi:hypothetical protein|uniref:hypothetical protein n=1 Tax=Cereibacter sphaeroides TaxID=1063 RepID=UPI000066413D|nr:hypothetical protein Rsph17029_0633 [Cereibacter sphaeroides ATCC 17029]